MPKFRSKVVEIEAFQVSNDDWNGLRPLPEWAAKAIADGVLVPISDDPATERMGDDRHLVLIVKTPEGDMKAHIRDWIICGTEGELYPCKPSVFERKYEPV
jgi:hypothetical protein